MASPRYLGLDYGDFRIGIAVSCPLGRLATGVETFHRSDAQAMKPLLTRLGDLIRAYGITCIVLGNPLHMTGERSRRSELTQDFAQRLRRNFKRLDIALWDERLSSAGVSRVIRDKRHIDEMAAVYILQGFLDSMNKTKEPKMDEQITMQDEQGKDIVFDVLASKEKDETMYFMAVEAEEGDAVESEAEILHFKCVAIEGDEMIFELVESDHEDFELVLDLFEDEYEDWDVEIEEIDETEE